MRLAYLDEAGISNPRQEPYLVVAGIILNGDQDWQPLERHLRSIARRHLPGSDGERGFIFHAKDLWHGSGYFDREKWSRESRREILAELIRIPRKFHLPIVLGAVDRLEHHKITKRRIPAATDDQITVWAQADAYVQAVAEIDRWMSRAARNEVVMLVAEDTPRAKGAIKLIHDGMIRDDNAHYEEHGLDVFTTRYVVDTVHFAEKAHSALLQIADACAFVIKRHIMGKEDSNSLFQELLPQLVSPPRGDSWRFPSEPLPRWLRVTVPRSSVEVAE